jgi:N utilization substance protein A
MNSEILAGLDFFERDKGIKREVLLEAINNAVLTAARKAVGPARDLRVEIDPKSGEIKAYAKLTVVEKVQNKHDEISFTLAKKFKPDVQLGDDLEVPVTPKDFGRIAAQTAKQAMMQRIRQAEKEMIYDEFKDRAGEIVSGTVRRFERSDVIVDLGKFEAIMPNRERVQTEDYNIGDRIRAYVVAVENGARGPEIILSRSHPNFVRRLFETEVSEINDRTVEIKGIAREAGYRTKIAVHSANEKVDIIRWTPDVKEFVLEALKPAKVKSVGLDEAKKTILIKVDEDQLSLAIGKRGQNARLTSRLTGWDINIEKDESAAEVFSARVQQAAKTLGAALKVDDATAVALVKGGLGSLDTLAEVEPQDIVDTIGISLEKATDIQTAAKRANGSLAPAQ